MKNKKIKPIEVEPLNSIEDVLFEARKAAFNKMYIPENIKKKYNFIINEKTKKTIIEEKRSKIKTP
ncbi:MAG: hypothetical protein WC264_00280 [Candidatus Paceibacterota bacterium]|jgi:hypothetical protein